MRGGRVASPFSPVFAPPPTPPSAVSSDDPVGVVPAAEFFDRKKFEDAPNTEAAAAVIDETTGCFAFVVSAAGFDAVACILCQLSVGLDMNWLRGVSACVSLARAILMQVHPFFYFH